MDCFLLRKSPELCMATTFMVGFCILFVHKKNLNGAKVLGCTKTAQIRPDVVMHTCNLGTVEAEVGVFL